MNGAAAVQASARPGSPGRIGATRPRSRTRPARGRRSRPGRCRRRRRGAPWRWRRCRRLGSRVEPRQHDRDRVGRHPQRRGRAEKPVEEDLGPRHDQAHPEHEHRDRHQRGHGRQSARPGSGSGGRPDRSVFCEASSVEPRPASLRSGLFSRRRRDRHGEGSPGVRRNNFGQRRRRRPHSRSCSCCERLRRWSQRTIDEADGRPCGSLHRVVFGEHRRFLPEQRGSFVFGRHPAAAVGEAGQEFGIGAGDRSAPAQGPAVDHQRSSGGAPARAEARTRAAQREGP